MGFYTRLDANAAAQRECLFASKPVAQDRVSNLKHPQSSGTIQNTVAKVRYDIFSGVNLMGAYDAIADIRAESCTARHCLGVVMTLHGLQSSVLREAARYKSIIDYVIATNPLSQATATAASEQADCVQYAPNGVATAEAGSTRLIVQRAARCGNSQNRLPYTGRLKNARKRVRDLPEILALARGLGVDANLSIAGTGTEKSVLREDHMLMATVMQFRHNELTAPVDEPVFKVMEHIS